LFADAVFEVELLAGGLNLAANAIGVEVVAGGTFYAVISAPD
jgi:hypothetical protein